MKVKLLMVGIFCLSLLSINAQKTVDATGDVKILESKDSNGWTKVGSIGLDLASLWLINPRPGAGDNRFGFGGLITYLANYKDTSVIWTNKFGLQEAIVSTAGGPFTKASDVIQFTSQAGHKISEKWYLGGLFDFQTQLLSTYGSNYLSLTPQGVDPTILKTLTLTSSFFSPATLKLSPGFIYKYDPHLSIFLSPIAIKTIICADKTLANTERFFPNPNHDKTIDFQLGAEVRLDYNNKFAKDRISYIGTLDLYSNYLRDPQNIAVEWYNTLDFNIIKNFSFIFKSDWFYDNNQLVFLNGDSNSPGRNVFIRNSLSLGYKHSF